MEKRVIRFGWEVLEAEARDVVAKVGWDKAAPAVRRKIAGAKKAKNAEREEYWFRVLKMLDDIWNREEWCKEGN